MAKNVNKELKSFITFGIIGGVMTLINLGLLALFVEVFKMNTIPANIISYLIAVILSYFANAIVTFNHEVKKSKREWNSLISYCLMKLILLGLDTLCIYFLVEKHHFNLYICKIILTIIFTLVSYIFSKKIIKKEVN